MRAYQRVLLSAKEAQARTKLSGILDDLAVYETGGLLRRERLLVNLTTKKAWRRYAVGSFPFKELQPDVIKRRRFATKAALDEALAGFTVEPELGWLGDIETKYIEREQNAKSTPSAAA